MWEYRQTKKKRRILNSLHCVKTHAYGVGTLPDLCHVGGGGCGEGTPLVSSGGVIVEC